MRVLYTPRILSLFLLFAFAAVNRITAENPLLTDLSENDSASAENGLLIFERALDEIWSGYGDSPEVSVKLEEAERLFKNIESRAARNYFLARIALYRGRIDVAIGEKSSGRSELERAMDLASLSIEERESGDAYRVMADAGASWMVTKGLVGIIRMAPQVSEWSRKALDLQPDNALALIISAQGQINAPEAAGGDPEAAALRLEDLLSRDDLSVIERYWGSLSLSSAYRKLDQTESADRLCAEASAIYPDNPMSNDCLGVQDD